MFWFDKDNTEAIFGDIRRQVGIIYDGRDGRRPIPCREDGVAFALEVPAHEVDDLRFVVDDEDHRSAHVRAMMPRARAELMNSGRSVSRSAGAVGGRVVARGDPRSPHEEERPERETGLEPATSSLEGRRR